MKNEILLKWGKSDIEFNSIFQLTNFENSFGHYLTTISYLIALIQLQGHYSWSK